MSKTKRVVCGALLLVCIPAGLLWHQQSIQRLEKENARWRDTAAQAEAWRDENTRLHQTQTDPATAERARLEQSELLRLRSEVAQLRRLLKEAAARSAALSKATSITTTNEEPVSPVITYVATTRAPLSAKQTLVTGGWATTPGKRTLAFVTPEPLEGTADGKGQVSLQTIFVEAPDEVLTRLGFDKLKVDGKESDAQQILSNEKMQALLKLLGETSGVDVLSAPKVTTLDGRQAQVKVVDLLPVGGVSYEVGPSIDIVPNISADGTLVDLSVSAQLRLRSKPRP